MHDEVTDPWELAIERIRSDPNFSVEAKRALIARTLSKRDGREVSPDEVVLPDGPVVDADPQ